ncbi:MAG: D-cysteine desulfhydrase family protein [Acidobacteriota bacterium]|nr:D-cysteine desulfhydrase family protein [Acidobacteriota bacterium]
MKSSSREIRTAATPGLGILDEYPRVRLCRLPTPLEAMPNLGRALGGARVYVKRDDCTDLAFGGNKVRQLEFYLGEARQQGADTILITGAVQSNFVRLAAAAARRSGMDCHIQLEERVRRDDSLYRNSGNVLLDRILGATLYSYPEGEDEEGADRRVAEIAEELKGEGRRPYIIPLGPGHPPLGALGYVVAAKELLEQIASGQLSIDEVVVPSGSGHTHGGLLFGLRALGSQVRVTGVCVRRNAGPQKERIRDRCGEIAELLETANPVADEDIRIVDDFLAPGYGRLNPPTLEAIRMAGSLEGLILDPVYTGKTMAGLIHRARRSGPECSFLLMHTGGTPAIFAYGAELTAELERRVPTADSDSERRFPTADSCGDRDVPAPMGD